MEFKIKISECEWKILVSLQAHRNTHFPMIELTVSDLRGNEVSISMLENLLRRIGEGKDVNKWTSGPLAHASHDVYLALADKILEPIIERIQSQVVCWEDLYDLDYTTRQVLAAIVRMDSPPGRDPRDLYLVGVIACDDHIPQHPGRVPPQHKVALLEKLSEWFNDGDIDIVQEYLPELCIEVDAILNGDITDSELQWS